MGRALGTRGSQAWHSRFDSISRVIPGIPDGYDPLCNPPKTSRDTPKHGRKNSWSADV